MNERNKNENRKIDPEEAERLLEMLNTGDPFVYSEEQILKERLWAKQHAMYWAGATGKLGPNEALKFADFFADTWEEYLVTNSGGVDGGMMTNLYMYRVHQAEIEMKELDNE